jgi:PST family polysaccharide transporter
VAAERSFLWIAADSGGAAVISLLSMTVIARAVGPAEFGLAALVIGFVQFVNLFVEGFFHDALIQRRAAEPVHFDSAFWCVVGMGLLGVAICWLSGAVLAEVFGQPRLSLLLGVASLSLLVTGPVGVANARLRRAMLFREAGLRSLVGRVIGATAGIALALLGAGIWSLILQPLAAAAVTASLLYGPGGWRPGRRLVASCLRELARYAVLQSVLQLLWQARWQGFLSLIGLSAGVTAVGHVSLAFRVVGTLQSLLSTSLQQFGLPLFARRQDERQTLAKACGEATEIIAVATFPLFLGLCLTAPDFVPLLLGPQWLESVLPLEILAIAATCHFSRFATVIVMNALGRLRYPLGNAGLCLVATLGAVIVVRPHDVAVATLLWAAPVAIVAALSLAWLYHELEITVGEQLRPLGMPLAAAAVMVLGILLLRDSLLLHAGPALRLAGTVLCGAILYGGSLLVLDPSWHGRIMALAQGRLPQERPSRLAAR